MINQMDRRIEIGSGLVFVFYYLDDWISSVNIRQRIKKYEYFYFGFVMLRCFWISYIQGISIKERWKDRFGVLQVFFIYKYREDGICEG